MTSAQPNGEQPIDERMVSCPSSNCVLKRQVFQPGAPVKTEYVDVLGRTIATGVEGFDAKEVLTRVEYNARGIKTADHRPATTGLAPGAWDGTFASPFVTQYSGIDVLGRPTQKTVVRSTAPDLFEPGKGSANLITTYAYGYDPSVPGVKTSITVATPTATSGQVTMSRTYDPRGKLVQTVQNVATPMASMITTAYVWDPAGNLTQGSWAHFSRARDRTALVGPSPPR